MMLCIPLNFKAFLTDIGTCVRTCGADGLDAVSGRFRGDHVRVVDVVLVAVVHRHQDGHLQGVRSSQLGLYSGIKFLPGYGTYFLLFSIYIPAHVVNKFMITKRNREYLCTFLMPTLENQSWHNFLE
jgi:hypothetical protein